LAQLETKQAEKRLELIDREGLDNLAEFLETLPSDESRELYMGRAVEHSHHAGAVTELLALRGGLVGKVREAPENVSQGVGEIAKILTDNLQVASLDLKHSGEDLQYARRISEAYRHVAEQEGPKVAAERIHEAIDANPEMMEHGRVEWVRQFSESLSAGKAE
jgi:hypothetical protein